MAHAHPHRLESHAGHDHGPHRDAGRRPLGMALALLLAFMAVEVGAGLWARSLALIADAGHMITDAGAIALALVAMSLAARPPGGAYTYGFKRLEILSAQTNGITLLLLGAWFVYEAIARLIEPPQVAGLWVTAVAVLGIGVNLVVVWIMSRANRQSLNVEGSFQHILTDLYAFIVTAVAGGLVRWTGWSRFDALAALMVAALMLRSGYALARDSGRIFLEAAPRGLDPEAIGRAICQQPGVRRVDELHVWEVTSGEPALSAHVEVAAENDCHDARRAIEILLHRRFGLQHTTLQMGHAPPGAGRPQADHRGGCGVSALSAHLPGLE
ncbi:MAG: cation transporter [Gammaproteobacteria bacterium]|nr:cation transporter [Gammaproteobacteria bacterium]